jgi:hypothetical protein
VVQHAHKLVVGIAQHTQLPHLHLQGVTTGHEGAG